MSIGVLNVREENFNATDMDRMLYVESRVRQQVLFYCSVYLTLDLLRLKLRALPLISYQRAHTHE